MLKERDIVSQVYYPFYTTFATWQSGFGMTDVRWCIWNNNNLLPVCK